MFLKCQMICFNFLSMYLLYKSNITLTNVVVLNISMTTCHDYLWHSAYGLMPAAASQPC